MIRIEQRLRDLMGLDANSIGSSAIHRTVRLRMKARGLQRAEQYAELLDQSPAERNELIESVVVSETWFFRDREAFTTLVRLVKEEWLPAHPTGILRILSVPCSSGEEPYSLVMALLDAGLLPERFRVEAADISGLALGRAREAVYTRNSFRGKDFAFRDRHFYAGKDGFTLDSVVRGQVSFFQGNIVSKEFPVRALYDVIFCRNLLIYFDRPTQKRALDQINRLLLTNGVLFVGPAEQPLITDHGFAPLGYALAFASRKTIPAGASQEWRVSTTVAPQAIGRAPAWAATVSSAPSPTCVSFESAKLPKAAQTDANDLKTAGMLADAGNLKEAAALCEAFLRANAASANGWYLLGLVREAGNDATAEDCYRKALYLDPNHYETLLQMALRAEKDGNPASARTFRSRAERLRAKNLVTREES